MKFMLSHLTVGNGEEYVVPEGYTSAQIVEREYNRIAETFDLVVLFTAYDEEEAAEFAQEREIELAAAREFARNGGTLEIVFGDEREALQFAESIREDVVVEEIEVEPTVGNVLGLFGAVRG
jgi:tRNA C32,U32 (ribose-2'-O)-methylase TrmJ